MVPTDCRDCGACCFSAEECYVLVREEDFERLGPRAQSLTHFRSGLCFMRMQDGHCAALSLLPDGSVACSVYEHRPDICHELQRGSSGCVTEIERKRERSQEARAQATAPHVPARRLYPRAGRG